MQQRSGFLIRFIDIGLIVLFGFLAISDIESFSRIDMPGSSQDQTTEDPQEMTMLTVEIAPNGRFTVIERESERVPCRGVDLNTFESCLTEVVQRHRQNNRQAVVLIQPDDASIVQHTVDVLDICDRHGIPKNINKSELKL